MADSKELIYWPKEVVLQMVKLWSKCDILYNSKHVLYRNNRARHVCLEKIQNKLKENLPEVKIDDIKRKMNHMRGQYARELKRIEESNNIDGLYKPQAYWFQPLEFLSPYVKVGQKKRNFMIQDSEEITMTSSTSRLDNDCTVDFDSSASHQSSPVPPPRKRARSESEDSENIFENNALHEVSSATDPLTRNNKNITADIDSFGEHLKILMMDIENKHKQDELQYQIYSLIHEYKFKEKDLEIDSFTKHLRIKMMDIKDKQLQDELQLQIYCLVHEYKCKERNLEIEKND